MKNKVTSQQYITEMCFGCGTENPAGLKGKFYNLEDGRVVAVFELDGSYQSYPGRLHGGITATLLDETLGRAILVREPDCWAVTADLAIRYKKPVPLNETLRVVAEVTDNNRRLFRCSGSLLLPDGEVAATATGVYIKQPLGQITDIEGVDLGSFRAEQESDLAFIDC